MAKYRQAEGGIMKDNIYTRPPVKCDICGKEDLIEFVDGATKGGPWGNMCMTCHKIHGRGLGSGQGQRYELMDREDDDCQCQACKDDRAGIDHNSLCFKDR